MNFPQYLTALHELYQDYDVELILYPGADDSALNKAEAELGFAIAPALRAAWQHANGGAEWQPVFARPSYLTGYDFLPLEMALEIRRGMASRAAQYQNYEQEEPRDPRIQAGWYPPRLVAVRRLLRARPAAACRPLTCSRWRMRTNHRLYPRPGRHHLHLQRFRPTAARRMARNPRRTGREFISED